MSIFATAWTWLKGSSISSSLVKTAAIAYGMRLLNDNLNKSSNSGVESTPDPGTRVQVNPTTSFKIPVLYGSAFFGGAITDVELTSNYKTMRYCITLAEQTGVKLSDNTATSYVFNDVYVNNNRVIFKSDGVTVDYTVDKSGNQDVSLRDQVKIYTYLPDPTQPEGYTGTTPAADTVMSSWTAATHPMTGLIYSIVEVTYNRAKNVTGIPNLQFHLTSDMTLPGDVLWDYMRSSRYGGNIPDTDIDNSLVALNTYASDGFSFALPGGVTSTTQYTINGLVNTANNVLANIEEVANNANSWISYDIHTGKWTTVINQMTAVEASLNDDQIVGEISISSTALSQLNSTAEVEFQNSTILDKPDYVRVTVPNEDLYDNEPQTVLEIKLPFINRQATALRVGLQYLKQGRVDKIISFTTDYSYLNLRAGDLIDITSSAFGFVNKEFRIIDAEEVESDTGEILISFKCLEYDEDVYYHDIEEYTVETDDGLLGIGTIGIPGTPQFSKIESDRRPRVTLESVSPAGVVEALEFWITSDVALAENQRTYRLLSSRYPTELVTETWPEGTNVRYDDDTLTSGDFLVKTRGVNSIVVGPFSEPSGLIEFVPQQTTDRIGPETQTMDALGQIVGALTLFSLLNKLFEMFDDPSAADKGIFERIFDLFREETGVDLVGDAASGSLVVASELEVQLEGATVTKPTSAINFVGEQFDASFDGNVATIYIDNVGLPTGDYGQQLFWDGTQWVAGEGCCLPVDFPDEPVDPPEPPGQCYLTKVQNWPPDRPTWYENDEIQLTREVPHSGSYFISYSFDGPIYFALNPGAGSAYLYLSDGTLVETLTSAQIIIHNDVVELPWANRIQGSDYYILIDEDLVNYCDCISPAITAPTPWNFNVAPYDVDPYIIVENILDDYPLQYQILVSSLTDYTMSITHPTYALVGSGSPDGSNRCPDNLTKLVLTFNEDVIKLVGDVELYDITEEPVLVASFPVLPSTLTGGTLDFGDISSYIVPEKLYEVRVPRLLVETTREDVVFTETECGVEFTQTWTPPQEKNDAFTFNFSIIKPLEIVDITGYTNITSVRQDTMVNLRSDLRIKYNRSGIKVGSGTTANVELYKEGGTLIQTFDLTDAFDPDYTSELFKFITTDEPNDTLLINPTHLMEKATDYYVLIDNGAIWDSVCNVAHAGTADPQLLRFRTDEILLTDDSVPAQPSSETPLNTMEVNIPVDRDSNTASGVIEVRDSLGNLVMTIPSDSPALTVR